jgi:hypothetical protein
VFLAAVFFCGVAIKRAGTGSFLFLLLRPRRTNERPTTTNNTYMAHRPPGINGEHGLEENFVRRTMDRADPELNKEYVSGIMQIMASVARLFCLACSSVRLFGCGSERRKKKEEEETRRKKKKESSQGAPHSLSVLFLDWLAVSVVVVVVVVVVVASNE